MASILLAAALPATLPRPARAAPATLAASGAPARAAAVSDGDGDDDAAELTYHWQDPHYSADERRQTLLIAALLASVAAWRAARRRLPAFRAGGGAQGERR